MPQRISLKDVLDYEVRASWWAKHCSRPWLQSFAVWYNVRKASRKYRRYAAETAMREELAREGHLSDESAR